jgi:hypothetical protein
MFKFLFRKAPAPLEQVLEQGRAGIPTRDEAVVGKALAELQSRLAEDAQKGEAFYGLLILMACECGMRCVAPHVTDFLERFPDSISPVKVEMAINMAEQGHMDAGSQLVREYLRTVVGAGHLQRLGSMPTTRRGLSRAFLPLTAACTHCGARSHSARVLRHAMEIPTDPGFHDAYRGELARLEEERRDPAARRLDDQWEAFFATGAGMAELATHCESLGCRVLAKRVELIEANFRTRAGYKPSMADEALLVREGGVKGRTAFVLA